MKSNSIIEQKSDLSTFEVIYYAAKEKDGKRIKAILSEVSIDVQRGKEGAPVSKLAAEGDIESVQFLREKFNASLAWTIYGYALGENKSEVDKILDSTLDQTERLHLMFQAGTGYAHAGNINYASNLLDQTSNPPEKVELIKYIIVGCAISKHDEGVKKLLDLASTPEERQLLLKSFGYGSGLGRPFNEAMKVCELASSDKHKLEIMKSIIFGHFRRRPEDSMQTLNLILSTPAGDMKLYNEIVYGASINGSVEIQTIVLSFISDAARPRVLENMACGYVQGGYISKAKRILTLVRNSEEKLAVLKGMACGYAYAKHDQSGILDLTANDQERLALFKRIVFNYAVNGYVKGVNKVLTENPHERLALLKEVIFAYAHNGFIGEVNNALASYASEEQPALIQYLVDHFKQRLFFDNRETSLFTLSVFNPELQSEIAKKLKESKNEKNINVDSLVSKANQLYQLQVSQPALFRFRYRIGSADWLAAQEWLLMSGISLVNKRKLNTHVFLLITSFIARVSYSESCKLYKLMDKVYRHNFFSNSLILDHKLVESNGNSHRRKSI